MNVILLVTLGALFIITIILVILVMKLSRELKVARENIDKVLVEYKQSRDSLFEKLSSVQEDTESQINILRLDNIISLTNETGKYVEGKIEDDAFIKDIGYFRISRLTDKSNGDVTVVYYNDAGSKTHTETLSNNKLKYSTEYIKDKLCKGYEYNEDGKVIFEYKYNDVGEVDEMKEIV